MTFETLELYAGYLCIKTVDTDSTEPFWLIRFCPCFPCNSGIVAGFSYPVGSAMMHHGSHEYRTRDGSDTRLFGLEHGGSTKPIHFERIPIAPPPNRGKPIRWYYGKYQRLLKTGWQDLFVKP